MSNTTWEFNGQARELNLLDADTADLYAKIFSEIEQRGKNLPTGGGLGDAIRAQCGVFIGVFDDLFGEGAGRAIVGEKDDLRVCMEAAASLVEFANSQAKTVEQSQKSFFNKYAPRKKK